MENSRFAVAWEVHFVIFALTSATLAKIAYLFSRRESCHPGQSRQCANRVVSVPTSIGPNWCDLWHVWRWLPAQSLQGWKCHLKGKKINYIKDLLLWYNSYFYNVQIQFIYVTTNRFIIYTPKWHKVWTKFNYISHYS